MLIAIWLILKITFIGCGLFLIYHFFKSFDASKENTFSNGFQTALQECGFLFKRKKYSLELYKWVIDDEEEVCEESFDRADWPAMDIADWMKVGLPESADGESLCGQDCSCRLVLYKKTRVPSSST